MLMVSRLHASFNRGISSENSSVEVTESRLCWSLLSESLRSGRGPAHAPPGCSLAHDDEEQEEEEEGA